MEENQTVTENKTVPDLGVMTAEMSRDDVNITLTYTRKLTFNGDLTLLVKFGHEITEAELHLYADYEDEGFYPIELRCKGIPSGQDADDYWEEEADIVVFPNRLDSETVYENLKIWLPANYPHIKWSFVKALDDPEDTPGL